MHFPSHLCTAGSNGSACILPSRAKPVPWLCLVLAVHSHLLSPPALPGVAQDCKLGVGVYSQGRDRSISNPHQWQRAHLSHGGRTPSCCLLGLRSCAQFVLLPGSLCWGAPVPAGSYETFSFTYFKDCAFALTFSKLVDVTTVNLQQNFPVLWTLFHTADEFCQNV